MKDDKLDICYTYSVTFNVCTGVTASVKVCVYCLLGKRGVQYDQVCSNNYCVDCMECTCVNVFI